MVSLTVNGSRVDIAGPDEKPLLWALREDLGLLGPKYDCGIAQCGACRVLVDGESTPSWALPLGAVANALVVTVEGLAGPDGARACTISHGRPAAAIELRPRLPHARRRDAGGHLGRWRVFLAAERLDATITRRDVRPP